MPMKLDWKQERRWLAAFGLAARCSRRSPSSEKAMDKILLPLISDKSEIESVRSGVIIMRVDVRDSLAQWFDEKPWRLKLILLPHTAVMGAILLIFGIRF